MGLIIDTRQFGLLWDSVAELKNTPNEPQSVSEEFSEVILDYGVFKIIQKTIGDVTAVKALLMFDNILNVNLLYKANSESGKINLVKDSWWLGDSETALHGLTPDNWISEFKSVGYWDYLSKSEDGTRVLKSVNKFFQKDYQRIPEIILNAIKSSN